MQKVLKRSIGVLLTFILCLSTALSFISIFCRNDKETEAASITTVGLADLNERKVIDFNTGWVFSKGEGYNNSLSSSEPVEHVVVIENGSVDENSKQVYDVGYDTSSWKSVSLPHTYNDIDTFDTYSESLSGSQAPGSSVSLNGERALYSGTAWYKKQFFIPSDWSDKEFVVEFEGARQAASVWVNGQRLEGDSLNGFVAFGYDITNEIIPGQTNEITVLVDNSYPYCLTVNDNGTPEDSADDFMETMYDADYSIYTNTGTYGVDETTTITNSGANIVNPLIWHDSHWQPNYGGLYRNSNLYVTNKLQLTLPLYSFMQTQGTYVYTTHEDGTSKTARVNIEAEVKNNSADSKTFTVLYQIYNANGVKVGETTKSASLTAGAKEVISVYITLDNVIRWSDLYPYQYTCCCSLWTGSSESATLIDNNETKFGIRTYRFTTDNGFYLNENYTYINGWGQKPTNEWAGIGAAYSDWMQDYVISQMKEGGANYIRYGHSAAGQSQITACDKYGIMVTQPGVDGEGSYSSSSPVPYKEKMVYTEASLDVRANAFRDMIIQFRNNPSIIAWEIGNKDVGMVWDDETNQYKADSRWADLMLSYVNTYDRGNRNGQSEVDNVGTKAETVSSSHRVITQRGDPDSPYFDVYESTLGSMASNKVNIEGEYNRIEARRGVPDTNVEGFQNFKNAYVSGQQEDYELSTSESFAVEQITSYYECVKSKGSAMMGGANWIYSDTVSHGRLLSEVARVSGEVDGTFLEKEAYYVNQVIFKKDISSYIIGDWNYPVNTTKTVYVAAKNATSVQLCVDWDNEGTLQTDTYEGEPSCDGMLYTFSNVVYKPGTIRTVVKNEKEIVVEKACCSKTTTKAATKLGITKVNTLPLLANGADYLILDIELLDEDNKRVTTDSYIQYGDNGSFTLDTSKQVLFVLDNDGTGEWIGGYNSFLEDTIRSTYLYLEAGIIRVAIRTTSVTGDITLSVSMNGMTPASIVVASNAVSDINNSGTAYNLVEKQPNRLNYSLESQHEPTYGSIISEDTSASTTLVSSLVSFVEILNGGTDFSFSLLASGSNVFSDQETVFTSVPEKYLAAEFLQTQSTNYSVLQETTYLSFKLEKACQLLVLINNRLTTLPTWMASYSFEKTGDIVIDSNGVIYDLYASNTLQADLDYFIGGSNSNNNKTMFVLGFYDQSARTGVLYENTYSDPATPLTTTCGTGTSVEITDVTDSENSTKSALLFVDKSATAGADNFNGGNKSALLENAFAPQTGAFTLEFDFLMKSTTTVATGKDWPNRFIRIVFQDGAAGGSFDGSGTNAGVRLFINNATANNVPPLSSGMITFRNKVSDNDKESISLKKNDSTDVIPINKWVTFKMEINVETKTYTIAIIIDEVEYALSYMVNDVESNIITYTQEITKLDHMIIASGGTAAGTFAVTNLRLIKSYDNMVEDIKVDDVSLTNFHEETHYYYVTKPNGTLYTETEIENAVVKMKLHEGAETIISPIVDKKRGLITVVVQQGDFEEEYYLLFNKDAYYTRLEGDYLQDVYSIQSPGKTSIVKLKKGAQAYSNTTGLVSINEYSNCYMGADLIVGGHTFGNSAIGINNLTFDAPNGTMIIMFLPFDHNVAYPWIVSNGFTKTNNFVILSNGEQYIAFEKVLTAEEGDFTEIFFTFDNTTFNNKFPIIAAISLTDLGEKRKEGDGIDLSLYQTGEFPSTLGTMDYASYSHTDTDTYVKIADSTTDPTVITNDYEKALHLYDSIGGVGGDGIFVYLPLEEKTTNFTINADFYIKNVGSLSENTYIRFFLQNGANSAKTNDKENSRGIDRTLTHIYFSAGNILYYDYDDNIYDGTNTVIATNVVPIEEWFTASYDIDFVTKTFVLKIIQNNTVLWTSDLNRSTPEIDGYHFTCSDDVSTNVDLLQISTGKSGKQEYYVKNIQSGYLRTNAITSLKYNDDELPRFDESGKYYCISLNSNNEFDIDNFEATAGTAYDDSTATGLSGSLNAQFSYVDLNYNYAEGRNLNYKVYIIGNDSKLIAKLNEIDYPNLIFSDYTLETWDAFIIKYTAAQNVLSNKSTNYLSLETAYDELNTTFNNLDFIESLSVVNVENGSFDSNKELSSIVEGDNVVITFNPNTGYSLANVEIDGITNYLLNGNVLTFTMPEAVVEVTPEYTLNIYTITWENEDGTTLETDSTVAYGTTPEYNGEEPTKDSDLQYYYTFSGWTPEIASVTGDKTYTAVYTSTLINYTITWENEDGTTLETDSTAAYGTIPEYNGEDPTKDSDLQYDYTFSGWSPAIASVTGDKTYTAVYTSTLISFTIDFNANLEGVDSPESKTIVKNGKTTLPDVSKDGFKFIGWAISGEGDIYQAESEFTVSDNFTLVGKWKVVLKTEGTTPEIEIEDENVDAGGVLKNTASLIVEKIEESDSSYTEIAETIGTEVNFVAYDITIKNSPEEILEGELGSSVVLKIKIPEGYDTERVKIYLIDGTNKTECTITKIEDGFAFVNANHFSVYVVAEAPIDNNEAVSSNTSESEPSKDSSPVGLIIGIIAGVVAIGVVVAIVIIKKKKNK